MDAKGGEIRRGNWNVCVVRCLVDEIIKKNRKRERDLNTAGEGIKGKIKEKTVHVVLREKD